MIVKRPDGYHVFSDDGSKHLGGPYKTRDRADKRLEQIEFFKAKAKRGPVPQKASDR